jgi:hypothetical protein
MESRGVTHVLLDEGLRRFSRKACGRQYTDRIVRHLVDDSRLLAVLDGYPEGWEGEKFLSEVYVFDVTWKQ